MRRLRLLDGRIVAGAVVLTFFVAFTSVSYAVGRPPWTKVGVGATRTGFEDLQSITSSWDCERRGIQAFPNNPCDPFHRPANYPRLWTKLSWTGLGEGDTHALGIVVGFLFVLGALLVPARLTPGEGVVYALGVVAPASLLGVERGNVDLLMFALLAVAVLVARRWSWLATALITFAGVLKLFPIVALAALVRRPAWRWMAAGLAVFALYAVATLDDIRAIFRVVPREIADSFGSGVVADALQAQHRHLIHLGFDLRVVQVAVVVAGLFLSLLLLGLAGHPSEDGTDSARLDGFQAGAAVYVLTYLIGNNFDYRLVFLLLCIPQLCAWTRDGSSPVGWPAAALVALLGTLWLSSSIPPLPFGLQSWYVGLSFPPEEVLNWFVFAWLTAALLATLGRRRTPLPQVA